MSFPNRSWATELLKIAYKGQLLGLGFAPTNRQLKVFIEVPVQEVFN